MTKEASQNPTPMSAVPLDMFDAALGRIVRSSDGLEDPIYDMKNLSFVLERWATQLVDDATPLPEPDENGVERCSLPARDFEALRHLIDRIAGDANALDGRFQAIFEEARATAHDRS